MCTGYPCSENPYNSPGDGCPGKNNGVGVCSSWCRENCLASPPGCWDPSACNYQDTTASQCEYWQDCFPHNCEVCPPDTCPSGSCGTCTAECVSSGAFLPDSCYVVTDNCNSGCVATPGFNSPTCSCIMDCSSYPNPFNVAGGSISKPKKTRKYSTTKENKKRQHNKGGKTKILRGEKLPITEKMHVGGNTQCRMESSKFDCLGKGCKWDYDNNLCH